ncbi:MAG: N-acetylmuramoyl-L-alanine amidase [Bacteroidetes bacterium]|nr:N-acetylmuramoyl-L-alanine amidase [Bacteroidota bacterium]
MRNRVKRLLRFVLVLVSLALGPSSVYPQEHTLKIEFDNDPSRNTVIGVFRRHTTLYASLSDLAQILSLTTYENSVTHKLEIKQPPYRIKVTGGSPFVVFTDQNQRKTVYQLPHTVIYAANSFFVPLKSFSPLFELLLNMTAEYDAADRVLRIGGTPIIRPYEITTVVMEQKANGLLIRIPSTRRLSDYESWFRQDGWLYLTIADARADTTAINSLKPIGVVKKIIAIQSPTSVQLTFRLTGTIEATEVFRDNASNDILVSIRTPVPDGKLPLGTTGREIQTNLDSQRKRWELDVIVIDAGHGGYDPGTIGVTGVREKDVTLGIALKLGTMIETNLKNVKVVCTRKTDKFVELYRRGQIANEANGKLFISIHANALRRKPSVTRGFEVYLLRPGRTEEAIAIAERENAVIELEEDYEGRYEELTEENFILVAMAQSAHMRSSEQFADITQREMAKHTGLPNRGVKQAGFYVLVGAAMPNVLIETGYLSNRADERFLKSSSGQQKTANSIYRAIKKYKEEYEKLLLEGKDLGAAVRP